MQAFKVQSWREISPRPVIIRFQPSVWSWIVETNRIMTRAWFGPHVLQEERGKRRQCLWLQKFTQQKKKKNIFVEGLHFYFKYDTVGAVWNHKVYLIFLASLVMRDYDYYYYYLESGGDDGAPQQTRLHRTECDPWRCVSSHTHTHGCCVVCTVCDVMDVFRATRFCESQAAEMYMFTLIDPVSSLPFLCFMQV